MRLKHLAAYPASAVVALALLSSPRPAVAQADPAPAPAPVSAPTLALESFVQVWTAIRDTHWQEAPGGLDWQAIRDEFEPRIAAAASQEETGIGLIEAGVKDGVAWENSVLMGARIKTGTERSQAIRGAKINASARWRELFPEVETVGIATIDGEEAYEVVMTPEEGGSQTTYFSVDSGLALRTDLIAGSQMGDIPLQVALGDYRDLDGILTATTMTQNVAGQSIRMTFDSVETNAEIPAGRFDLPAPVAALVE